MIQRHAFILLSACLFFVFSGCQEQSQPVLEQSKEAYSFFTLGHAYGHWLHVDTTQTIYPPFAEYMTHATNNTELDFGVLLGDQVLGPEPELYDRLDSVLAPFNRPVFLVPGNHDFYWDGWGTPLWGEFDQRSGDRYSTFRYEGDLFFIVDSNTSHWRIMDEQWEMVQRELMDLEDVNNVFFFVHNILWWEEDPGSTHNYPAVNSTVGRHDSLNFWSEVIPRLEQLDQQVYFFAGDAGANCSERELTYFHESNYHLIAYGMGCRTTDGALNCKVDENGVVRISVQPTRHFDRSRGLWLENYRYF